LWIILNVELDADLLEVPLDERFNGEALGEAYLRRVLELQALAALGAYSVRTSHPASVIERFIGCCQVEQRAGSSGIEARMIKRGMVGAQRRAQPFERLSDDGLLIHRHGHGLAHFRVAGQHRIVKVEKQPLEGVLCR
jgi:hypothetical protein